MHLVIDRELARGPSLAVEKMAGVLNSHGETVQVVDAPGEEPSLLIGLAGRSKVVAKGLARSGLECPSAAESVLLHPLTPNQFLIAGSDERGLTYALLEAARAIQIAPLAEGSASASLLDYIPTEVGSPYMRWRSMQVFICNRELEREWFYDEEYWEEYLDQLALYRYNNLSLTFRPPDRLHVASLSVPAGSVRVSQSTGGRLYAGTTQRQSQHAQVHFKECPTPGPSLHAGHMVSARSRIRRADG